MTTFYKVARLVLGNIVKLGFRRNNIGLENVPEKGGFILCCNHTHFMDVAFLVIAVKNHQINFMAKQELFKNKLCGWFFKKMGAFPIVRGSASAGEGINKAEGILREGSVLGIFPEGTRSKTGEMGRLKPGSLLIALKSGVPLIPAYITPKGGKIKAFKGLGVRFGEPIDAKSLFEGADLDDIKRSDYRAADEKLRSIMLSLRMEEMQ